MPSVARGRGIESLAARNCLPHNAGSSRYNFRDHFTAFRTTQREAHREGLRMQLGGPAQPKSWRLGFWSLIATQFQGAFNDNGLKFFVIYLILGQNPSKAEKDFGVFLIGNLTRDPQIRYTPKGTAVADIGLAVNRVLKTEEGERREEVTYVDVVLWGRVAEIAHKYLKKGRPVFIEGRLQLDAWDDKQTG